MKWIIGSVASNGLQLQNNTNFEAMAQCKHRKKAPGNRIFGRRKSSSKISEFCRKKHVCVLTVNGKWFRHIPVPRVLRFGPHLRVYMRYEKAHACAPGSHRHATPGFLKRSHAITKDREVQDLHA